MHPYRISFNFHIPSTGGGEEGRDASSKSSPNPSVRDFHVRKQNNLREQSLNISTHCLSNPPPEFRNSSQFLSIQKQTKKKNSQNPRERDCYSFSRESRETKRVIANGATFEVLMRGEGEKEGEGEGGRLPMAT